MTEYTFLGETLEAYKRSQNPRHVKTIGEKAASIT